MKILVCGSRDFIDYTRLSRVLEPYLGQVTQIIEGEAKGADSLARAWAEYNQIPCAKFPADWEQYGKAAGPVRNKQMLVEGKPDLVIAFLATNSKGTANMIKLSRAAAVETIVVNI